MNRAVGDYVDIEVEFGYKKEKFLSLDTDESKFDYAYKHFNVFCFDKFKNKHAKSLQLGELLKSRGNNVFKNGDYRKALKLYTGSIIMLPQRTEREKEVLSITLANRSAALYHIGEYKLALVDIDLAVDNGYPRNLTYKVLERKARCLLALKRFKGAQQAFRKAVQSLSEADLPNKKQKELLQHIQEELTKLNKMRMINDENDTPEDVPVVASGKHSQYTAISTAVEIVHTDNSEYAVASRDIEPGEVLNIEEPHCSFLLPQFRKVLCFHCLKRAIAPQPCPDCCQVVFCSVKCQGTALSTHHKYECSMLGVLWKSQMARWFLALRMITQRGLQYFLDLRPTLKASRKIVHSRTYSSDDYRTVYSLRSEGTMQSRDLLEMAVYAVCYLHLLQDANFFIPAETVSRQRTLSDEEKYIGGLILHNILVSSFKESMMYYFIKDRGHMLVGFGMFPTNICFGHSCVPSVWGYYDGSTLTSQALCSIKKGEKITVNNRLLSVGREYINIPMDLAFNQRKTCKCEPCKQHWPHMLEICQPLAFQKWFRCNCGKVLSSGPNSNFVWCSKCIKELVTDESGAHQQEIIALCKQSMELQSLNLSEAHKKSLKAASLLKRGPVELVVFYTCLETVKQCLRYYGNVMSTEELSDQERDEFCF